MTSLCQHPSGRTFCAVRIRVGMSSSKYAIEYIAAKNLSQSTGSRSLVALPKISAIFTVTSGMPAASIPSVSLAI